MGNMIRLFSVADYFAVQTHSCNPVSRPFTLAVKLTDTFLEQNNRTFLLYIEGSHVALVESGVPDAVLSSDISEFSSFVIGALPLSELLRLGRMQLDCPSYARDIQNAIGWDIRPCNYTYF